jgi:hypothetical protein
MFLTGTLRQNANNFCGSLVSIISVVVMNNEQNAVTKNSRINTDLYWWRNTRKLSLNCGQKQSPLADTVYIVNLSISW